MPKLRVRSSAKPCPHSNAVAAWCSCWFRCSKLAEYLSRGIVMIMKKSFVMLAVLLAGVALASADIIARISVKAILNPATGNRQPGVSDVTFSNTVVGMNAMLQSYGRGYQLQWLGNA